VTEEGSESAATRGSLIHNLFFRFDFCPSFLVHFQDKSHCVLGSKAQDGTQGGQDGRTIADKAEFVADHPFLFYLVNSNLNDPETETSDDDEIVLNKKLSYAVVLMSGQLTSI
jgi:hypothetical protein